MLCWLLVGKMGIYGYIEFGKIKNIIFVKIRLQTVFYHTSPPDHLSNRIGDDLRSALLQKDCFGEYPLL